MKDSFRSLGRVAPGAFSFGEVTVPLHCVESRPSVLRLPKSNGSVERRGQTLPALLLFLSIFFAFS